MKKLIINERQLSRLVSFIMEDSEKPSEEDIKYKNQKKLNAEIQNEFFSFLNQIQVCDDILFFVGDAKLLDGKGPIMDQKSVKVLTLRAYNVTGDGVKAKVVDVKGRLPFKKDDLYYVKSDAFNLDGDSGYSILYKITKEKNKRGKEIEKYTPQRLSDVLTFDYIDNKNQCEGNLPDIDSLSKNTIKQWFSKMDDMLRQSIYEPGFLGMDNIFFFPLGFKAMDKILAKYGLSIKKDNINYKNKVKFKILTKPSKNNTPLKLGAQILGTIDYKGNIVVNNYYFEIDDGNDIYPDAKIKTNVYSKTKTSKIFLFPMTIEILGFTDYNQTDPNSNKPEKEETPTTKDGEDNIPKDSNTE